MCGTFSVESEPGRGSTFSFTAFFDAPSTSVESSSPAGFVVPAELNLAGTRVLVVEDNPINREVAREILGAAGVSVVEASSGFEAVEAVDRTQFAAVLMDIQMPVMDGYEATRRIRLKPEHKSLPIIAMTAHVLPGYREKCLAAGMDDYVTKPVGPESLFKTLGRWVKSTGTTEGVDARKVTKTDGSDRARAAEKGVQDDSFPGVNVPEGLQRLDGNRGLYFRMFRQMVKLEAGTPARIRLALEEGRKDDASRYAHSLKGVAASLSMPDVAAAAMAVERSVLENDAAQTDIHLTELERALEIVIEGYRSRFPQLQRPTAQGSEGGREAKTSSRQLPYGLRISLEELHAQTRNCDLQAPVAFKRIRMQMERAGFDSEASHLETAFESLDFNSAASKLAAILGE
jgi:CheY-like chemotaxis protein/HPt (histidine-containing phosphotransfer) domain-containing protein